MRRIRYGPGRDPGGRTVRAARKAGGVNESRTDEASRRRMIILTGGGTGGHLYPALAVAEALRAADSEVPLVYLGKDAPRDREAVLERGLPFQGYSVEGMRRKWTWTNARGLWRMAAAAWQCRRWMKPYPPGVVFGVGGYVSAPAMLAGRWGGWKLALHEQNARPGAVNRIMARWCHRIYVTYPATREFWKNFPCQVTGFPLRRELIEERDRAISGPPRAVPGVLVTGGSQGARRLVEVSLEAFRRLSARGVAYQAVVQTGERNYDWAQTLPRPSTVELVPYIQDMAAAYRNADVVVSRAGAGTLSEIALWGLPAILVPYPFASGQHQSVNARVFLEAGAARVAEESDLTPERLAASLAELLEQADTRREMSRKAAALACRSAAEVIANDLLALLKG